MTAPALVDRVQAVLTRLARAQWIPLLLTRLFVGYFFFETGWSKTHNLDAMAERFADWGIPFPAFSAALSGYTELIGGGLILVGLFTRLAAIPLFINMVVAILTVKMKAVTGLDEFVELDEPMYALAFLWLFFAGPGPISLDHVLWSRVRRRGRPAPRPT
jgi:putative oxidoreductase